MSESMIFIDRNDIDMHIDIPDFFGTLTRYKVIWIRPITKSFCEVSLANNENGYTNWLVKIEDDQSITPISCTLYFNEKETKQLRLGDSLHLNLLDKVLKERISEYGNNK
jgi:hypothetical protein